MMEGFLYEMGEPEVVRIACEMPLLARSSLMIFTCTGPQEEQLGALLRLVIFAARQVGGEPEYNVVKISADGRKVSFLQHGDFNTKAHPKLRYAIRGYLPRAEYSIRPAVCGSDV